MADEEKKDPKSPYGRFSLEDIVAIEAGHYFIQVGSDIFCYNEKEVFTRDRAEMFYDSIFKDLTAMKEKGDEVAQADAKACLFYLRIHKMRVH
jgi:hypothetical protein